MVVYRKVWLNQYILFMGRDICTAGAVSYMTWEGPKLRPSTEALKTPLRSNGVPSKINYVAILISAGIQSVSVSFSSQWALLSP